MQLQSKTTLAVALVAASIAIILGTGCGVQKPEASFTLPATDAFKAELTKRGYLQSKAPWSEEAPLYPDEADEVNVWDDEDPNTDATDARSPHSRKIVYSWRKGPLPPEDEDEPNIDWVDPGADLLVSVRDVRRLESPPTHSAIISVEGRLPDQGLPVFIEEFTSSEVQEAFAAAAGEFRGTGEPQRRDVGSARLEIAPRTEFVHHSAWTIRNLGPAVPMLVAALADGYSTPEVAKELQRIGQPALNALIEAATNSEAPPAVRGGAAIALKAIPGEESRTALKKACEDPDRRVRAAAEQSLSR